MQVPQLQRVQGSDQNLQFVQDSVAKAMASMFRANYVTVAVSNGKTIVTPTVSSSPWAGGKLISVALTAGQDNLIPHGLGFVPRVWVLARLDANTNVWEVATSQLANSAGTAQFANAQFLNLWCGSNCNVAVWVN